MRAFKRKTDKSIYLDFIFTEEQTTTIHHYCFIPSNYATSHLHSLVLLLNFSLSSYYSHSQPHPPTSAPQPWSCGSRSAKVNTTHPLTFPWNPHLGFFHYSTFSLHWTRTTGNPHLGFVRSSNFLLLHCLLQQFGAKISYGFCSLQYFISCISVFGHNLQNGFCQVWGFHVWGKRKTEYTVLWSIFKSGSFFCSL